MSNIRTIDNAKHKNIEVILPPSVQATVDEVYIFIDQPGKVTVSAADGEVIISPGLEEGTHIFNNKPGDAVALIPSYKSWEIKTMTGAWTVYDK
jgi:hypothetical protein